MNRVRPALLARGLVLALAAAVLLPLPGAAAPRPAFRGPGVPVWPIATAVLRIATFPFGALFRNPAAGADPELWPEQGRLDRDQGWRRLGFPLAGSGRGLMIEVCGRAEFRAVEILFDDGEVRRVNLGSGRACDGGLYELARFDDERPVRLVRCEARARSGHASLRVLLVRRDPEPAAALRKATHGSGEPADSPGGPAGSGVVHGIPAPAAGSRPAD